MASSRLHNETKMRVINNIMVYIFKPANHKHDSFLRELCMAQNVGGFKYKGIDYSPYHNVIAFPPLHKAYHEAMDKHLTWYTQVEREKNKISWALAQILLRTTDLMSIYKVLPTSLVNYSNIAIDTLAVTDITISDEEVLNIKEENKETYALLEASLIKRMLVV